MDSCILVKQIAQTVVVNGSTSSAVEVTSGVPQGTVLGPLLFLCYINDLPTRVKSQVRLFADDCLLYRSIASVTDALQLQEDLTALEIWAEEWKMHFNPTKCYVMRMHRSRSPIITPYSLCNHVLDLHTTNPYLGVLLSDDAKWSPHIDKMCNKANSTLGFLRMNLSNCPTQLKELSYIALVQSKLKYAACVWNPHLAKDVKKIEAVQRRSARFVTRNYNWDQSVTELIKELGWESLETRRTNASLTMLYKIVNNEVAIKINEHLERSTSLTRKKKHYTIQTHQHKH